MSKSPKQSRSQAGSSQDELLTRHPDTIRKELSRLLAEQRQLREFAGSGTRRAEMQGAITQLRWVLKRSDAKVSSGRGGVRP
jgi:hypothetical protein